MKKTLCLLLVLLLCAGLCACAGNESAPASNSTGGEDSAGESSAGQTEVSEDPFANGPVEIVWWTNYGALNVDYIQTRIDLFNESQEQYHVTIERQGGVNELKAKLQATEKQNLPAMFSGTPATTSYYVASGFTVPIQQFIDNDSEDWTEGLYDVIRTSYSDTEGNMYGYPFGVSCTGIWVNVDALTQAGYTLEDLTSFDKVAEAAAAIVNGGYTQYGVGFHKNGAYLSDMLSVQGVDIVDMDDGYSGDATKCLYTEGETYEALHEAMEIFSGLYQNGYGYTYGSDVNGEIIPLFSSGDIAMFYGTNSYAGKLITSNTSIDYAFIPMVGVNDQAEFDGALSAGTGNYIADNGNTVQQQGAYELIKFLAQDEHQAYWCLQTGYVPYTESCAASEEYTAWMTEYFPSAGYVSEKMLSSSADLKGPYVSVANEMLTANVLLMEMVATNPGAEVDPYIQEASETITEALEIAALSR